MLASKVGKRNPGYSPEVAIGNQPKWVPSRGRFREKLIKRIFQDLAGPMTEGVFVCLSLFPEVYYKQPREMFLSELEA